ncbi:MAG: hypothetical protein LH614_11010 [Pyrinomonadaceae bacterium]|nr:hypothetical protein [Pyrinomonadaceae bacterium]
MQQIKFTSNEFIIYGAIAGGILGLVLGIIILILGFVKKKRSYAVFGFLGSVLLGPVSGILSIIVAAIFIWLILKKPNNSLANSPDLAEESDSEFFDEDISEVATPESKTSDSEVS